MIPMLEIMMERLLFTGSAGKHTSLLTNWMLLVNPWHACTMRVTDLGGLCVCVCVCAFYSPTTRYLSYNMMYFQGQRTIEKVKIFGVFSKNAFNFFKLRRVCVCYHVFANYKFGFFYKDTSFESYDTFSL